MGTEMVVCEGWPGKRNVGGEVHEISPAPTAKRWWRKKALQNTIFLGGQQAVGIWQGFVLVDLRTVPWPNVRGVFKAALNAFVSPERFSTAR
jgi:hypothetical protein